MNTSCTKSSHVSIEDLIRDKPSNFIDDVDNLIIYENICRKMCEIHNINPFKNKKEIRDFIQEMQKIYSITVLTSSLLFVYRMMCSDKNQDFEYDEKLGSFLQIKNKHANKGVLDITVFTSAYPMIKFVKDRAKFFVNRLESIDEDAYRQLMSGELEKNMFSCEYDCWFCPNQPKNVGKDYHDKVLKLAELHKLAIKEEEIHELHKIKPPRSYLTAEPGVLRGHYNMYDAVLQFWSRAKSYIIMGYPCDKIELLILGGTWSSYSVEYQYDFVRDCYYAANTFYDRNRGTNELRLPLSLQEERNMNRHSLCRIIGLTLETRPDKINSRELKRFREMGVTRVQLGVQHTNDRILDRINRLHHIEHFIRAATLLRRSGFKYDIHLMPDLPQPVKDKKSLQRVRDELKKCNNINQHPDENDCTVLHKNDIDWNFDMVFADLRMFYHAIYNTEIQADQWKIYPCETVPYTQILREFIVKSYIPYGDKLYTWEELNNKYPELSKVSEINDWSNSSNLNIEDFDVFRSRFFSFINDYHKKVTNQIVSSNMSSRQIRKIEENKTKKYNILFMLIMFVKIHVKPWVRLNRVIRDIPGFYHVAGVSDTNMRQYLHDEMFKFGYKCNCIRCRQIKADTHIDIKDAILDVIHYNASGGQEFFIQYITRDNNLIGFVRLRIDPFSGYNATGSSYVFKDLIGSAMIRELHVYGKLASKNIDGANANAQHLGFGTKLMIEAEKIARRHHMSKMTVIAGEGVRDFYMKKLGFQDSCNEGYYMIKHLNYSNGEKSMTNKNINKKLVISLMFIFLLFLYIY